MLHCKNSKSIYLSLLLVMSTEINLFKYLNFESMLHCIVKSQLIEPIKLFNSKNELSYMAI